MEFAPLRSLDDFLLGSARFQLPNYKDVEKWGNRVAQNLMYYQTNYFLMSLIMFMIVTLLYPMKMFYGYFGIAAMYGIFHFKKRYQMYGTRNPLVNVFFITLGAGIFVYLFGCFVVFLFGVLLPLCSIFIHASLRLRNLKNKLSNIERVVSNQTPMGILLESLGMEPKFVS